MFQYLTIQQADAISDKIREEFDLQNQTNVDITVLANKFDCDVFEAEFDDNDISGMIVSTGERFGINVSRFQPEYRKRFTIAHELAHRILHAAEINKENAFVDYRRDTEYYEDAESQRKERQANILAGSLLMPKDLIIKSWNELKDVDDIAVLFNVSRAAAAVRLDQLDLI